MAQTTGDVIVEQLLNWGVDAAFGMPGDGINGIFEALRKNRERIRFIRCRQVRAASQGRDHQEQRAGPDQVGADGLPWQPRVRSGASSDRLRQIRGGMRRGWISL